ncbi:MAG: AAA family ATPase [Methylococcaceae bacterium]|nr:AAA family ATPase [Methylococcaceae bacterium]
MSHIKKLEINNFRCFEKFEIGDFKAINLFVGKSNSGKSCLLESLFSAGDANPLIPAILNNVRGLEHSSDNLKYIFHKFNLDKSPSFKFQFNDKSNNELKISPKYTTAIANENTITSISSATSKNIIGIDLTLKVTSPLSSAKTYEASYIFDKVEQKTFLSSYQSKINTYFIPTNSIDKSTLSSYSKLIKKRKEGIVLELLQKIEPKILEIHALPDGLFFRYDAINELVPIQILGNGIQRVVNIITQIANETNDIVLIDEIETGLHFSAHTALWKGIFSLCKKLNTQLFITTHSIETLKSLKEVLELNEYQEMQDNIAVFNLVDTQKQGLKSYCYSFDGIKEAIELNQEMRY